MKAILVFLWTVAATSNTCLHAKNLVVQNITISEIINNHETICDEEVKHFPGIVMGHISPYYNKGKELSVKYARKFDIIAPTWFKIGHDNDCLLYTSPSPRD
eukprot:TRINITY_DN5383_c0_g2_i6.p1 TRINITY_DN5383_c0_g2~~TRINITY_DN5383_c0_g2_i6.p1  ORF type:complete len:102 (-),score=6.92 TRINITY_DN5383_c0_g2_i6:70-375(-)